MLMTVRTLLESDLVAADAILSSAFQRSESWKRELRLFQKLQPDGIFLACWDDRPAGVVATTIYSDYAYVGLMGVHQDFQRKGVGMALMQHILAWMQMQNMPVVRLDASRFGQPLYEKLGFVPLEEVYVLQKQKWETDDKGPLELQSITSQDLDRLAVADRQAFGADRTRLLHALLESYPGRAFMAWDEQGRMNGYLFAQEKRVGPWVMHKTTDAERLLLKALSLPFPGTASVVVPAENPVAIALLQRHGFKIVRVNRHMAYGANTPAGRRHQIFGQTSLSMG